MDWRGELILHDEYSAYSETFIKLHTKFYTMPDGHLDSIHEVQQGTTLQKADNRPMDPTSHRVGPISQKFQKQEMME